MSDESIDLNQPRRMISNEFVSSLTLRSSVRSMEAGCSLQLDAGRITFALLIFQKRISLSSCSVCRVTFVFFVFPPFLKKYSCSQSRLAEIVDVPGKFERNRLRCWIYLGRHFLYKHFIRLVKLVSLLSPRQNVDGTIFVTATSSDSENEIEIRSHLASS